jgi:hypothetical protein
MSAQPSLFDWEPPTLADFDGESYSRAHDRLRLNTVLGCVYRSLLHGERWTLHDLTQHCERELGRHVSQTSVSAKLRDLRKTSMGGYDVRSERVGVGGTWVYWLERDASEGG